MKLAVVAALLVVAGAPIAGVTEVLTDRDIAYALNVANGSESTRKLFHSAYVVGVYHDAIDHLDVITEFRRFVLAAEDQLTAGNWMMGRGGYDQKGRTLKDVLRPHVGQVSIRARLRFHPLNNYSTLPAVDVLLGEPTLLATDVIRTPHISYANGQPGSIDVIEGATIEVFFNAPAINDRVLPVRLLLEGKELARASVDFSRVE
jgi:hypothetical protein